MQDWSEFAGAALLRANLVHRRVVDSSVDQKLGRRERVTVRVVGCPGGDVRLDR
jgi:hypothetical protein